MLKQKITRIAEKLDEAQHEVNLENGCDIESLNKVVKTYENAFEELKIFVSGYMFRDEAEEIEFFKDTKPRLFCPLIYYRKICNIELSRPKGGEEVQKEYVLKEFDQLKDYFDRNIDFYKYFRSNFKYLDRYYFRRGKPDVTLIVDSFYYERAPEFAAGYDFKVARILANDMLEVYLNAELTKLKQPAMSVADGSFPKTKLTWTGDKIELIELIYALHTVGSVNNGKASVKSMVEYFENVLNIDLGDAYRAYLEIRSRTGSRTKFIDGLRNLFCRRMDDEDSK